MPKINWLDKLNDEQAIYAAKIAEKATQMGVPPELALSVAYHESGLNPRKIGGAKEIGLMQVLPATGRDLGFSPGDLHVPEKNIEAGLKYLKAHLNTYGSPELATLAYNRGPGVANKFIAGESDEPGQNYVKSVQALGGFSRPVEVLSNPPAESIDAGASEIENAMRQVQQTAQPEQDTQAQNMAGLVTGGIGAGIGAKRAIAPMVAQKVGDAAQYLGQRAAQGAAQAGGLPTGPAAGLPAGPAAGLLASGPGSAVVNYARAFGLPEIEAQRALDMTKQEGGVLDLTTQRRQGLQEIKQRFPSETYVENPRFGGLMTPDYEKFGGPRAPGAPRPAPIPTAPPKPSGLEQVSQTFRGMMAPAARLASRVLAPLGLYSTGSEAVAAGQELAKPSPDYASAAASGVGALGGVMSLFPPTAAIGVPMAIAGPAVREEMERSKQRATPEQIQQMLRGPAQPDMSGMIQGLGR